MHLQPCYQHFSQDLNSDNFKNSFKSYKRGLSLPSLYALSDNDQDYIIEKIKNKNLEELLLLSKKQE